MKMGEVWRMKKHIASDVYNKLRDSIVNIVKLHENLKVVILDVHDGQVACAILILFDKDNGKLGDKDLVFSEEQFLFLFEKDYDSTNVVDYHDEMRPMQKGYTFQSNSSECRRGFCLF